MLKVDIFGLEHQIFIYISQIFMVSSRYLRKVDHSRCISIKSTWNCKHQQQAQSKTIRLLNKEKSAVSFCCQEAALCQICFSLQPSYLLGERSSLDVCVQQMNIVTKISVLVVLVLPNKNILKVQSVKESSFLFKLQGPVL